MTNTNHWKEQTWKSARKQAEKDFAYKNSWTRKGLEKLVREAVMCFESDTGIKLPYNFEAAAPYVGYPHHGLIQDHFHVPEQVFRFVGWFKEAARIPILRRFVYATQSINGVNSSFTTCDLWDLAKVVPSPGRLAKLIHRIKFRGDQILSGFGLNVSWAGIAYALEICREQRIGAAAKIAAAHTLQECFRGFFGLGIFSLPGIRKPKDTFLFMRGWNRFFSEGENLKALRGFVETILDYDINPVAGVHWESLSDLTNIFDSFVLDETDGVKMFLDTTREKNVHGICVLPGWSADGRSMALVRWKQRTFHMGFYPGIYKYSLVHPMEPYRDAVKNAIRAWKKQDIIRAKNPDLEKLTPDDRTILVWPQDAVRAGNCQTGINRFIYLYFPGRNCVSAKELLKYIQNPHVLNVLKQVAQPEDKITLWEEAS